MTRKHSSYRISIIKVKLFAGILGGLMLAAIVYWIVPPIMALTQETTVAVWKAAVHPLGLSWGKFSVACGLFFLAFVLIFGRFRYR